ncbi:MAG: cobalamin-binding protein [Deltaproteobacteria bacterium]|nr:cobalamin-binding protein [Deltaproteobacteria bacterium]
MVLIFLRRVGEVERGVTGRSCYPIFILASLILLSLYRPLHADTYRDDLGREVTLDAAPKRIVSLGPNITEILFAIGLDKEIVGVTLFSDYPEGVKGKTVVGSYVNVNLERLISLSPDLVISTSDGNPKGSIERLLSMGIPVFVIAPPRNIGDIISAIRSVGRITGREGEAKKLVDEMEVRIGEVVAWLEGATARPVFYQLGDNPLMTVGGGTFIDTLITMAAGRNIAGDVSLPYPRFSMEGVVSNAPEVIVISSMAEREVSKAALKKWGQWEEIPAVRSGEIHFINPDLIHRAGPRIVDGLDELARMIHPERFARD